MKMPPQQSQVHWNICVTSQVSCYSFYFFIVLVENFNDSFRISVIILNDIHMYVVPRE